MTSRRAVRSSTADGTSTAAAGLPPANAAATPRAAEPPPEYRPPAFEGLGIRGSASLMRSLLSRPTGHPMTTRSRGNHHVDAEHDGDRVAPVDSMMNQSQATTSQQEGICLGPRRPALKRHRITRVEDVLSSAPDINDYVSHALSSHDPLTLRLSTEDSSATDTRNLSGRHPNGDVDPPSG